MKKWIIIPVLAGAVILGGVGIVANADKSDVITTKATEGLITIEEATAIAIKSVGGIVTDIELDKKRTGYIYEVELNVEGIEQELDISAETGEILRTKKDNNVDDDDELNIANHDVMNFEEVIAIARENATGIVTEISLDNEDGRLQYEVEIKDGKSETTVEIDAVTGEVLELDIDNDDDND